MWDASFAAPIIAKAVDRLDAPPEKRAFIAERVMALSAMAAFRPLQPGKRITPERIMGAMKSIERGLQEIASGLRVIHDARVTIGIESRTRDQALEIVQQTALRLITEAVLRGLSDTTITHDRFNSSMPKYGAMMSRQNNWSFDIAASRMAALNAKMEKDLFHAPTREREEWFVRAVGALADVYRDATGKDAKAYERGGDALSPAWRPPFVQFIADLWPLFALGKDKVPSNQKIADALDHASKLPPLGTMK